MTGRYCGWFLFFQLKAPCVVCFGSRVRFVLGALLAILQPQLLLGASCAGSFLHHDATLLFQVLDPINNIWRERG